MQRLAIMLAMMVLGAPQIYGCHTNEASRVPGALPSPYLDACPGVTSSEVIEMGPRKEILDTDGWSRRKAVHCHATQSILSYTYNQEGWAGTVKFEQFRQLCGVSAMACRDAAATGMLKIGTVEYIVDMNITKSHGSGSKDCPCGLQRGFPGRRVIQILMETLVRSEWVWLEEAARMIVTSSDRTAMVREDGQVTTEDRLYVWEAPSRVGEVEPSAAGGGSGLLH